MYDSVKKDYLDGSSILSLSKKYNIKYHLIYKYLKDNKIKIKSNRERYSKANKNIFKLISNEDESYWLGILYSDGNVYTKKGKNTISLSSIDKDQIEKFKNFINIPNKIYIKKESNQGYSNNTISYTYQFSSINICNNLKKYGIIDNKTNYGELSLRDVNPKLHKHFWRGMIDGDGWITQNEFIHRNNKIRKQIRIGLCGSYNTCLMFKQFIIENKINATAGINKHYSIFKIVFSDRIAIESMNLLYNNSTIFLDRKMKIFKKLKKN